MFTFYLHTIIKLYHVFIANPQIKPLSRLRRKYVTCSNKRFSPIHILYLLNLDTMEFVDIALLDARFKVNDIKSMLNRCNLESGSIIITYEKLHLL